MSISNSFVGATEREEARYGFSAVCDEIVYSHEVGIEKPDPRIFELALARLGVRPEESIFLDDLAVHVEAARALGMKAVLYESNAQAIAAIEAHLAR
jgi:glucose-1-phosphatase